ncbi:MAG: hypothetical protein ACREBR_04895 [bacterium]
MMQEAKVHVYDGIPLPERGNQDAIARRNQWVEEYKKEWEDKFKREWTFGDTKQRQLKPWTPEQRSGIEERLRASLNYTGNKLSLSTAEMETWLEWANGRYEITQDNEVVSYAREDKKKGGKPQVWPTGSEAEAEAKIADLLQYLIWNRSIGRGNIDEDLSGTPELK